MPKTPGDHVDAVLLAGRDASVERRFGIDALPRAPEAGALDGTELVAGFRFARAKGGIAVDVALAGKVVLTCQRCLRPVELPLEGDNELILVGTDAEADALPEGREPVVADASHLDLAWLAEEEMLLALPLVPLHGTGCEAAASTTVEVTHDVPDRTRQKPFENLRELLRKQ